ncbi:MAG: peptidoglycan DD-metalloendopeptidase family protein [Ignavibacteriaceae bacterium]|nr:peptidoglycan DD-metalloendopeptidase family protein [Ignavibacteriaceae bacterium]
MKKILNIICITCVLVPLTYSQSFRIKRPVLNHIQTNGSYLYGEPRYGNAALAHLGIDIAARYDTIYSATSGVVTFVGYNPNDTVGGFEPTGAGNYIVIRSEWSGTNHFFFYMHLKTPFVNQNQTVTLGQPVALSGNTGNSTGPHLHFEIRKGSSSYGVNRSRRNAELWCAIDGMGAIYGTVPNAPNSTRVDITPDPKPRPPYTTFGYALTYNFNDPYIGSDDIYGENYAIGDVKPGTYTIRALGGTYTRVVTVTAGEIVNADASVGLFEEELLPAKITLFPNYPNPVYSSGMNGGSSTTINFSLIKEGFANLTIYDITGQIITELFSGFAPLGLSSFTFEAAGLPSGVYFYVLRTDSEMLREKMLVLK